jgi:O-antigen ligase
MDRMALTSSNPQLSKATDNNAALWIAAGAAVVLFPLAWIFGDDPILLAEVTLTLAAIPAVVWILRSNPAATPYLLIVAIYLGMVGVKFELGVVNVRPNMLVALIAAGLIGPRLLSNPAGQRGLPFLAWLLSADAVYLLSTLWHRQSPFFSKGIADCFLFLLNVLQYVLVARFLLGDAGRFGRVLRFFLYVSTIYAGLNILAFVLGQAKIGPFGGIFDYVHGDLGYFVRIKNFGTTEGTYVGFTVVVLLSLLLFCRENPPFTRKKLVLMLMLNGGAFVLTFARGPWLAVALTLAMLVAFMLVRLPRRRAVIVVKELAFVFIVLAVAGGGLLLNSPSLAESASERFTSSSVLEAGTAAARIELWENMWEDWKLAPWFGHGAHDYAKFRDDDPTGISENFLLEFLHSAGLVGFSLFCITIVTIVVRGIGPLSSPEGLRRMPFGLPILAGFCAMCLSSLTNPGMTGGFFWAVIAFLVCAEKLVGDLRDPRTA